MSQQVAECRELSAVAAVVPAARFRPALYYSNMAAFLTASGAADCGARGQWSIHEVAFVRDGQREVSPWVVRVVRGMRSVAWFRISVVVRSRIECRIVHRHAVGRWSSRLPVSSLNADEAEEEGCSSDLVNLH